VHFNLLLAVDGTDHDVALVEIESDKTLHIPKGVPALFAGGRRISHDTPFPQGLAPDSLHTNK
jgi:hypothetical protein